MPAVDTVRLRDRRDELDLSNAELAARLQMSRKYVENILYGYDTPSRRVIHRFSRVLDLPVHEIEVAEQGSGGGPSGSRRRRGSDEGRTVEPDPVGGAG